jgi:hypothetical protein
MAKTGKTLQIGGGSRRPSQARAEDAARRSRKRADERRWRRDEEGRRSFFALALPDPATPAELSFCDLHVGAHEFNRALQGMTERTDLLWTQPRI